MAVCLFYVELVSKFPLLSLSPKERWTLDEEEILGSGRRVAGVDETINNKTRPKVIQRPEGIPIKNLSEEEFSGLADELRLLLKAKGYSKARCDHGEHRGEELMQDIKKLIGGWNERFAGRFCLFVRDGGIHNPEVICEPLIGPVEH